MYAHSQSELIILHVAQTIYQNCKICGTSIHPFCMLYIYSPGDAGLVVNYTFWLGYRNH